MDRTDADRLGSMVEFGLAAENENRYLLLEVFSAAFARFGHRSDAPALVTGAMLAARDLLALRPTLTEFVPEIALATSLERHTDTRMAA